MGDEGSSYGDEICQFLLMEFIKKEPLATGRAPITAFTLFSL